MSTSLQGKDTGAESTAGHKDRRRAAPLPDVNYRLGRHPRLQHRRPIYRYGRWSPNSLVDSHARPAAHVRKLPEERRSE